MDGVDLAPFVPGALKVPGLFLLEPTMKKLFSPFPHVLPIALTSGHTFVVTQEPVNVPDMYVAEAMSRGAQEAGNESSAVSTSPEHASALITPEADQLAQQRADKIKEALTAMVNGSDEADFTKDGAPQLARVKARTGFSVSRAEVDGVWAEISAAL